MNTYFDCIPCLIRQSLASVRLVTDDERIHEQILREVLHATSQMDLDQPPAAMAQIVHRRIRQLHGNEDPYRRSKDLFNRLALDLLPVFKRRLEDAPDPWEVAVRLAIAGNVMDLGVKSGLSEAQIRSSIDQSLDEPLEGSSADFGTAVAEAKSILYLTDNAGEIVFDRLLIEHMPREKLTVAVKGAPVINDATLEDAEAAGLTQLVRVIDNGSDAPGTILADCSQTFQQYFAEADLIVAKGQGNYETLRESSNEALPRTVGTVEKNLTQPRQLPHTKQSSEVLPRTIGTVAENLTQPRQLPHTKNSKRIYFLLRVKCPVIARDIGCPVGRMVLQPS